MTKLAGTYLRLGFDLSDNDRALLSEILYRRASVYSEGLFGRQKLRVTIDVEVGSTRARIAAFGSVMTAIATTSLAVERYVERYGEFRHGLDTIIEDARGFSERVRADVEQSGVRPEEIERFERRLGVPGQLQRAFGHLDRLQVVGRDMSREEYDTELQQTRRDFMRALNHIDRPEDREAIRKVIASEMPQALPPKEPSRVEQEAPIAIRPRIVQRDIEMPRIGYTGRRQPPRKRTLKVMETSSGGFQFVVPNKTGR